MSIHKKTDRELLEELNATVSEVHKVIVGQRIYKRKGLIERVGTLEKGFAYLAICVLLSVGLGAAASHTFLLGALKLILP